MAKEDLKISDSSQNKSKESNSSSKGGPVEGRYGSKTRSKFGSDFNNSNQSNSSFNEENQKNTQSKDENNKDIKDENNSKNNITNKKEKGHHQNLEKDSRNESKSQSLNLSQTQENKEKRDENNENNENDEKDEKGGSKKESKKFTLMDKFKNQKKNNNFFKSKSKAKDFTKKFNNLEKIMAIKMKIKRK